MTEYEPSRYDRLPEAMREHARAYVERHQPVGGFLTAVLSNDLVNAFGRADPENRAAMRDWALWLWNDIPAACWGSPEKVEAWLKEPYVCDYHADSPGWDACSEGRECEKAWHPGATLTGGSVPAHTPGAYQNLSCCGGGTKVVEA